MVSDKAYLTVTAVVSVLVLMLASLTGVAWWLSVPFCLLIMVGGLLAKRHVENKRVVAPAPPSMSYQPPPPPATVSVQGIALPSAHPDYRFLLHGTIVWRLPGPHASPHPRPEQLAIDALRERAARFTEGESPADVDLLATRLGTELSFPRPDRTGTLEVWAQDTILAIPDDDRVRLNKIAAVRKNEEVWDHERAYERNKRAYLRDDVLTTTSSAVVWWLAQDTTRVSDTVSLIGTLAQLVAAAQNREVEPLFQSFVRDLSEAGEIVERGADTEPDPDLDALDRLMANLVPDDSGPEQADLADRLAGIAEEAGATDLASVIRERFGAPVFTEQDSWFAGLAAQPGAPGPQDSSPGTNGTSPPAAG
ncbi:hypothetical protein [Actinophytocola xinjiangensis]|nr:hypothetical protein [Actinophytocola xinjiangensis]